MNVNKKELLEENEFLKNLVASLEDVKAGRVEEWKITKKRPF